ncbi:hypothetical protein LJB85_04090 [Porphyromonadaceae bacterium OttesenSCG-928-L07]|nr:hypothetical protein [Porphyromonadaceae bacterium OttesenSCG-928-L07]
MRNKIILLLVLLFNAISSIGQKVEKVETDSSIIFQNNVDYWLFTVKSVESKLDTERYQSLSFKIKLPNVHGYWGGSFYSFFYFFYKYNQVIFLQTPLFKDTFGNDTTYIPSNKEIETIMNNGGLITKGSSKWLQKSQKVLDKRDTAFDAKRKDLLIRKDGSIILLFNIRERDFDHFHNLVQSFTVLNDE